MVTSTRCHVGSEGHSIQSDEHLAVLRELAFGRFAVGVGDKALRIPNKMPPLDHFLNRTGTGLWNCALSIDAGLLQVAPARQAVVSKNSFSFPSRRNA